MNGVKRLNVSLSDEMHRAVKVSVAEKGTTITQFVIDAVAEKLENDKKKKEDEEK